MKRREGGRSPPVPVFIPMLYLNLTLQNSQKGKRKTSAEVHEESRDKRTPALRPGPSSNPSSVTQLVP